MLIPNTVDCQVIDFMAPLLTSSLSNSDPYAVWTVGNQVEFQADNGTNSQLKAVYPSLVGPATSCSNPVVPFVSCHLSNTAEWSSEMFDYGDEVPGEVASTTTQHATLSGIAYLNPSTGKWTSDVSLKTPYFGTDDCNGNYVQTGTTNAFSIWDSRRTASAK